MNGRSSERFAAGDEQLSAGGEGRGGPWAAGEAQSDWRLATSNYLPEGRDTGAAGEAQSDLRLATSNYLPEGRESGEAQVK